MPGDTDSPSPQPDSGTDRACPFCGGPLRPRYAGIPDRLLTTSETFAVAECRACGAGVLDPAPRGDLSRYYPDFYLSGESSARAGFDPERWYRYNQYAFDFELLRRTTGRAIGATGSYLDLGCGSGERLTYARERGCARVVGVDKFDFTKAAPGEGVEIVNSEIRDYVPEPPFSVVSLFHVLEHLERPGEVLAHVRERLLAPEGHLILQVPNYASLERRRFGARWYGLDAPRHLWQFTPAAVGRLLEAHGLRVQAVHQRNAILHPVTIAASLVRDVDVQRIWVRRDRGPGYRRAMTLLWAGMTLLTVPVSVLQSALGRGSMLTVVASPA